MPLQLGRWLPAFPIRERWLYLDHAAVCPLPRPVAAAMRRRIEEQELEGYERWEEWRSQEMSCRHLGAQLLDCPSDDVTLIKSTSEGLSLIAEGLSWREGDEVLVGEEEFASNVAPWLALERCGVRAIRFPQPDGRIDPDTVAGLITPRTRVLTVSWVSFHTGWIAPLARLGRICRDAGVLLVVDGIQGLGVVEVPRGAPIDALVADGHKWMLGPEGVGLMRTSPALRARLDPTANGWRNVERGPRSFFLSRLRHRDDGRRFEPGVHNTVGIAGLATALDLLTSVGVGEVAERVELLTRMLTRILLAHGWDVVSPGSGQPIAGIVAARHPSVPPEEAERRLHRRRVICSVRQGYLRLSPHFYTTKGELEALDRILEKESM